MMAEIDGEWNVVIRTPMGAQAGVIAVSREGSGFSGRITGDLGSLDFSDGVIDGDSVRWSMSLMKPMPMKLSVRATVSGDTIEGTVDAGFMGAMPLNGTRNA